MAKEHVHTWWIFRIESKPAGQVGIVEASDAETAKRRAIEKYEINDPEQQKRLVALRQD
jgi:hypothetical protein